MTELPMLITDVNIMLLSNGNLILDNEYSSSVYNIKQGDIYICNISNNDTVTLIKAQQK